MAEKTDASETTRGTLGLLLILLFCSAWLFLLVAGWIFPRLGGPESTGAKTIERIRCSTGTWQRWDMFSTIPTLRGYELELSGELVDGSRKTYGPVVPDLKDLDGVSRVRYHYAFGRILRGKPEFLDAYIAQAGAALQAKDSEVERFSIHILTQPIRSLEYSREDGELWTTVTEQLGPFPVNDD